MKTFAFLLVTCLFSNFNYAQKTELIDSVSMVQSNKQKVITRGHLTIRDDITSLYVIDGVPMLPRANFFENLDPGDIKSIQILRNTSMFSCYSLNSINDVILIATKDNTPAVKNKVYPFKTYKICNDNWNFRQDVYNDIRAKVPNVSITTTADLNAIPKISMRGDDNTIVIVDGIRYDTSVLNTLNPADIESITVSPSAAASNYLRNN